MGDYNYRLTLLDVRTDLIVPVGQDAVNGGLKGLGAWEHIRWQTTVPPIETWVPLVRKLECGRRDVIASAPLHDLLLAMLLSRLRLVEALEGTVVALIESPRLVVGDE